MTLGLRGMGEQTGRQNHSKHFMLDMSFCVTIHRKTYYLSRRFDYNLVLNLNRLRCWALQVRFS